MSDFENEVRDLLLEEEGYDDPDEEILSEASASASASDEPPRKPKPAADSLKKINCHFDSWKRSYKTRDGYRKHLGQHVVEDLLMNAPGLNTVIRQCRSIYLDILQDFQKLSSVGGITGDLHIFAATLQSVPTETAEIFVDCLAEELWACLPAPSGTDIGEIHPTIIRETHMLLANLEKRSVLLKLLKDILQPSAFSDKTVEWFLTEFVKKMSLKIEVFYIQCLKEPYKYLLCESEKDRDSPDSINFQQSVHFIGGSVVNSVKRRARLGLGSDHWSDIDDCINNKFLAKESLPGPGADVEAWTDSVDRGGLKHINAKVWAFLMALSAVLKKEEGADGSILHKKVLEIVTTDDVMMFLWNDITENSLKEEVDLLLLNIFCEFFANAWLRGVLRRKNDVPRISRDVAALRSKLA